jgi:hypothetical protein
LKDMKYLNMVLKEGKHARLPISYAYAI